MIMFTSGTTGKTKGVMLSQTNLLFAASNKKELLEPVINKIGIKCNYDISYLLVLPMSHIAGVRAMLDSYIAGNTTNIVSNIGNFYYELSMMPSLYIGVVPVLLEKINKDIINGRIDKLNGAKIIGCAGASVNVKTLENLIDNGISIIQHYGLTETAATGTTNISQEKKYLASVGKLDNNINYKIVDGELLLNGKTIMSGYYNDREYTKKIKDKDGWVHTGDLLEIDKDGFFYVKGRKKNTIILSSGENINPEEIEKMLLNNKKIIETYVKEKNNKICACIYCKKHDQSEIKEYINSLNKTLPYYKNITLIEFSNCEFKKTITGKIKR